MDYLEEKFADFQQALNQMKKAVGAPFSELSRDASIQRFEFTFELFWKTVKMYLKQIEGFECNSPKSCFREIRTILDLSEADIEQCLAMTEDRNLSVHMYSEKMADDLYAKLPKYLITMELVAKKIKEKSGL